MKSRKPIIIVVLIILLCLSASCMASSNARDNYNPTAKEQMTEITSEWARLAPIPDSKTEYNIYTEGNSFTRSFKSSFYLPKADLEKWIKQSPGLCDAEIETIDNTKKYTIKPGGGAQYAEVVIDFKKCYVEIYVCWS
ncbi:MAG: hypothetical protein AAGU14_07925 [Eubacteriaceae bacterium]